METSQEVANETENETESPNFVQKDNDVIVNNDVGDLVENTNSKVDGPQGNIQDDSETKEGSPDTLISPKMKPKKRVTKKKKKIVTKKKGKRKRGVEDEEETPKKNKEQQISIDEIQKLLSRKFHPLQEDLYQRPVEYELPYETPDWRRYDVYDPWEIRRRLYNSRL